MSNSSNTQSQSVSGVYSLSSAGYLEIDKVGPKAKSLGILRLNGIKVPNGFVITADEYLSFIKSTHLDEMAILATMQGKVSVASLLDIKNKIMEGDIHDDLLDEIVEHARSLDGKNGFIVRSSAVSEDGERESSAGLYDSYVCATLEDLPMKIKSCWASIFNENAVYYLNNRMPNTIQRMSVIVQELIIPDVSGVIFSADPVSGNKDKIIIEVVKGSCENLVSGSDTPDRYVIDKREHNILERYLTQPGIAQISVNILKNLANLASQIEKIMVIDSLDLEWGVHEGVIYIFQSRPITTLAMKSSMMAVTNEKIYHPWWSDCEPCWRTDARNWAINNRNDIAWNGICNFFLYVEKGMTHAYLSDADVKKQIMEGKFFFDEGNILIQESILENLLASFSNFKEQTAKLKFEQMSRIELSDFFYTAMDLYGVLTSHYRSTGNEFTALFGEDINYYLNSQEIEQLDKWLSHEALVDESRDFRALCNEESMVNAKSIRNHLENYPWLVINHYTYNDACDSLLDRIEKNTHLTQLTHPIAVHTPPDCIDKLPANHFKTYRLIKKFRNEIKQCWASFDYILIPFFMKVSELTEEDIKDINQYYLMSEITSLINDKKKLSLQEKNSRHEKMIFIFSDGASRIECGDLASDEYNKLYTNKSTELNGSVACRGEKNTIQGEAVVLRCNDALSLKEARQAVMISGKIIITSMTQFNALDVIVKSVGIVTDEGGVLSHAAIIAREYGIPCIVGTGSSTQRIKTGDQVIMNLDSGDVSIVD
ncbi:PEP/pyruvate-binding domain-containing protein [Yersinia mollaretii]|uniref:PEP/pyruvate-binding domain-containing protein n=1 Tax=Yersinia mollaretii TaxID=33060 RepID=UPI0025AAA9E2|nr:PEP/pyruvate-binding domain-containing protein [Yersinia mollaretii]MDN0111422.1 PEP/pyruvate-binding domain-containing protein [Yersinia mollaretii]